LGDTIMAFLLNLSSKTDISPKGFISLVSFVHDAVNNDSKPFVQKLFQNCLKLLSSILRDNQLLSVQEWPVYSGGGPSAACMLTTHILRIFNVPFHHQVQDRESEQIASEMAKADMVHLALNTLRYLTKENIPIAIQLISRLVFSNEASK